MARLHEYQGKEIPASHGFTIPRGRPAFTADEAVAAAKELAGEVVIKIQAWITGRAGLGGVAFAQGAEDVRAHAARMLAMKVGQFPVEVVLVEEIITIAREFFLSFAIDDPTRAPVIIFSAGGGTHDFDRAASGFSSRFASPFRERNSAILDNASLAHKLTVWQEQGQQASAD